MTNKYEALRAKQQYMSERVKLWKKIKMQPSIVTMHNPVKMAEFEANRAKLIAELDFCNGILQAVEDYLKN